MSGVGLVGEVGGFLIGGVRGRPDVLLLPGVIVSLAGASVHLTQIQLAIHRAIINENGTTDFEI